MAQSTDPVVRVASLRARHLETNAELKRYRLLVESVQDYAIFLMDPEGYVQTWNKGAQKIKGYKPSDIIGKHFSNFYLPHDVDTGKPERELKLAMRFGRIEDEDWRVRKDGTKFWANVIITALYDESNTLVGFAKVTRDLTERKQHEDELLSANVLLRRQQMELERLNDSKDEFISLASHQLRTPATGIKQYLGLLLEGFLGDLSAEQLNSVQQAYECNDRQLAIVNSLLKVAQLDAGKIVLRKKPTNIADTVRCIVKDTAEKIANRGQHISLDLDGSFIADVDAVYYRMALENVIDNASKYTPSGGHITISGKSVRGGAELSVKDDGVGVDQCDISKLFSKFSRLPNELSDSVGGSGLGLYWTNKVVSLHGGTIRVESEVGKGSKFQIWVPAG